jgi:hypothetical protein
VTLWSSRHADGAIREPKTISNGVETDETCKSPFWKVHPVGCTNKTGEPGKLSCFGYSGYLEDPEVLGRVIVAVGVARSEIVAVCANPSL